VNGNQKKGAADAGQEYEWQKKTKNHKPIIKGRNDRRGRSEQSKERWKGHKKRNNAGGRRGERINDPCVVVVKKAGGLSMGKVIAVGIKNKNKKTTIDVFKSPKHGSPYEAKKGKLQKKKRKRRARLRKRNRWGQGKTQEGKGGSGKGISMDCRITATRLEQDGLPAN